ncbi:hypothetical protein [Emticicia sp. CRIBPO]|uniref:hypothetical protein n=1 Tax=Emticicia sp. CRIBPO TaxID=2683258 RepID=UPI001E598A53|nr:hypothetical protein [Emticicia sp. CRIBPO]
MKRVVQKLSLAFSCLVGLGLTTSFAQDTNTDNHTVTITIPEVALLDLETTGSKSFTMAFVAPDEAGSKITAPTATTTTWLNYSSIVAIGTTRTVTVAADVLVGGVDIKVSAAAPAGGGGALGGAAGPLTLTTTATALITSIGSCWTGTGNTSGHQLTYELALKSDYESLKHGAKPVVVTYTLTDDL